MFEFFYEKTSPFSNWFPSPIIIEGKQFSCVVQYYTYCKACLFCDYATADEIMKETNPYRMKLLGHTVKGFRDNIWAIHKPSIMRRATLAKYTQNPNLRTMLLSTGSNILVYASPNDRLWGIGLAETDSRAQNPSEWRGYNLLGQILTEVRQLL